MVVQGIRRFAIRKIVATDPYLRAEMDLLETITPPQNNEWQAEFQNLRDSAARLCELRPDTPEAAAAIIRNIDDPEQLADFLAPNLDTSVAAKAGDAGGTGCRKTRARRAKATSPRSSKIAQIQQKLQKDVQSQFQRRATQGLSARTNQGHPARTGRRRHGRRRTHRAVLRTRLEEAKPPAEVLAQAERELKRLDIIPPASPEYSVIVSYVETIAELPWSKLSEDNLDLDKAQQILDRDHYDLKK